MEALPLTCNWGEIQNTLKPLITNPNRGTKRLKNAANPNFLQSPGPSQVLPPGWTLSPGSPYSLCGSLPAFLLVERQNGMGVRRRCSSLFLDCPRLPYTIYIIIWCLDLKSFGLKQAFIRILALPVLALWLGRSPSQFSLSVQREHGQSVCVMWITKIMKAKSPAWSMYTKEIVLFLFPCRFCPLSSLFNSWWFHLYFVSRDELCPSSS